MRTYSTSSKYRNKDISYKCKIMIQSFHIIRYFKASIILLFTLHRYIQNACNTFVVGKGDLLFRNVCYFSGSNKDIEYISMQEGVQNYYSFFEAPIFCKIIYDEKVVDIYGCHAPIYLKLSRKNSIFVSETANVLYIKKVYFPANKEKLSSHSFCVITCPSHNFVCTMT